MDRPKSSCCIYPSDLKVGGDEVSRLVREYSVRLIDMGQTHYNKIANDSETLSSATRSTGQIKEGPVGYSVTSLDSNAVRWRFVELGGLPIRAKFWGDGMAVEATAHLDGQTHPVKRRSDSTYGRLTFRLRVKELIL